MLCIYIRDISFLEQNRKYILLLAAGHDGVVVWWCCTISLLLADVYSYRKSTLSTAQHTKTI